MTHLSGYESQMTHDESEMTHGESSTYTIAHALPQLYKGFRKWKSKSVMYSYLISKDITTHIDT